MIEHSYRLPRTIERTATIGACVLALAGCGGRGDAASSGAKGSPNAHVGGRANRAGASFGGSGIGGGADAGSTFSSGGAAGSAILVTEPRAPSCASNLVCSDHDCCESREVPGASFMMGRSLSGADACPASAPCFADELPEHNVVVSRFYLDTMEVTVGRFRAFVGAYDAWRAALQPAAESGASGRVSGSGWESGWSEQLPLDSSALRAGLACGSFRDTWVETGVPIGTWTEEPGDHETLPITCINWYLAFAFCIWDHGRLPTEAEWEYAAAGADENRLFPWGSTEPNFTTQNYSCQLGSSYCSIEDIVNVAATRSPGRFLQSDLGSNVAEWVLDGYSATWYALADASRVDPANLDSSFDRVFRGGDFGSTRWNMRAARRDHAPPTMLAGDLGLRCARDRLE